MLMVYDVKDESNITESDQLGTGALIWRELKACAVAHGGKGSMALPLVLNDGTAHPTASLIINIKLV
jgi:hypothetical protein